MAAATRGSSPWLSVCVLLAAVVAVLLRRAPAAPPVLRMFAVVTLVALAVRVVGVVLLGSGSGTTVLLDLPAATVWPGITFGGPVTAESLRAVAYTTGQLAAILICLGAACELAPPRRLLPYLPAGLYEVGTAVVVALTYAPQVAEHAAAVRTARALRRPTGGRAGLREMVMLAGPVLDAALDRSVALAASMESRGFARTQTSSTARRRVLAALSLGGLAAVVVGMFLMLGTGGPTPGTLVLAGLGVAAVLAALLTGHRTGRTRYRLDPWRWPETVLVTGGVLAVAGTWWAQATVPGAMTPDPSVVLPDPPLVACAGILLAALAAVATPPVEAT